MQSFPGVYTTSLPPLPVGIPVGGGNSEVLGLISGRVVSEAPLVGGNIALIIGQSYGQVTGLNLSEPPTAVVLTIQVPTSTSDIFYAWIVGTPTTDGFYFQISGLPQETGYVLNYKIQGDSNGNTISIPSSSSGGTVTGLNLPLIPTAVVLTVQSPNENSLGLFATIVGNPSYGGFTYELNGLTDSAEYILNYTLDFTAAGNQVSISPNFQAGSVSGLGLSAVPSYIIISVIALNNQSDIIFANITSLSSSGFTYVLSAIPSFNYILAYSFGNGQGSGVSNIPVLFSGVGLAVTNQMGFYSRAVPIGWTGTATPLEGVYSPPSRSYVNIRSILGSQNYVLLIPEPYRGLAIGISVATGNITVTHFCRGTGIGRGICQGTLFMKTIAFTGNAIGQGIGVGNLQLFTSLDGSAEGIAIATGTLSINNPLRGLIPNMTSDTTPSGIVTSSSQWNPGGLDWFAFSNPGSIHACWSSQYSSGSNGYTPAGSWIQYTFASPVVVHGFFINYFGTLPSYTLESDVILYTNSTNYTSGYTGTILLGAPVTLSFIRLNITGNNLTGVWALQLLG